MRELLWEENIIMVLEKINQFCRNNDEKQKIQIWGYSFQYL